MEIILIILILTNIFACIGWYRADDKYNDEWEKRNFTDQGLTPPLKENPTKGNQKTRKQILKAKERRKNGKLGEAPKANRTNSKENKK